MEFIGLVTEDGRAEYLSVCLSEYLSVCLSEYLSV